MLVSYLAQASDWIQAMALSSHFTLSQLWAQTVFATLLLLAPAVAVLVHSFRRIREEDRRLQLEWDTEYHPPAEPVIRLEDMAA